MLLHLLTTQVDIDKMKNIQKNGSVLGNSKWCGRYLVIIVIEDR